MLLRRHHRMIQHRAGGQDMAKIPHAVHRSGCSHPAAHPRGLLVSAWSRDRQVLQKRQSFQKFAAKSRSQQDKKPCFLPATGARADLRTSLNLDLELLEKRARRVGLAEIRAHAPEQLP